MNDGIESSRSPQPDVSFHALARALAQTLGLVLILLGVYFSAKLFLHVWARVQDPSLLSAEMQKLSKLLVAEQYKIGTLDIGPFVCLVTLLTLFLVAMRLALTVLAAGHSLISTTHDATSQQRELFRDFLATMRQMQSAMPRVAPAPDRREADDAS